MDWWKNKEKKKKEKEKKKRLGAMLLEDFIKCCDGKANPIKFFSADFILKATNNFSTSIRVGYHWEWYSGKSDNYRMILIKKFASKIRYVDSCFCRDVAISSMVSGHKNFLKLAGCCLDYKYPVTVYYGEKKQYAPIDLLKIVSWKRRMKIAEDIATALAYLHTAFSTPFVYRNMSIENILIDEDGVAKLSDFSFCIPIPVGETFVKVDYITGTIGYTDANYIRNSIVSEKTDAYGFGICMLLLLMGGRTRLPMVPEQLVCEFIEKGRLVDEIADPNMLKDMGKVTIEERSRMNAFLMLSVRCLGIKGEVPTMVEVAKELKKIQRYSQNAASTSYDCKGEFTLVEVAKELKNIQLYSQKAAATFSSSSSSFSRNLDADSYYSDGSDNMDYLQGR